MKMCPHCPTMSGPTWDHLDDCPYWPGSEWSRRNGYRKDCGGLANCEVTHPYVPHDKCDCEGSCFSCAHISCERCTEQAYNDRPWWRKLLGLEPGRWRRVDRTLQWWRQKTGIWGV